MLVDMHPHALCMLRAGFRQLCIRVSSRREMVAHMKMFVAMCSRIHLFYKTVLLLLSFVSRRFCFSIPL